MTEKEFISCFDENIKLTCIDGKTFEGYVISFTWADDAEDGIAEIDLVMKNGREIVFKQTEVEKIEIID